MRHDPLVVFPRLLAACLWIVVCASCRDKASPGTSAGLATSSSAGVSSATAGPSASVSSGPVAGEPPRDGADVFDDVQIVGTGDARILVAKHGYYLDVLRLSDGKVEQAAEQRPAFFAYPDRCQTPPQMAKVGGHIVTLCDGLYRSYAIELARTHGQRKLPKPAPDARFVGGVGGEPLIWSKEAQRVWVYQTQFADWLATLKAPVVAAPTHNDKRVVLVPEADGVSSWTYHLRTTSEQRSREQGRSYVWDSKARWIADLDHDGQTLRVHPVGAQPTASSYITVETTKAGHRIAGVRFDESGSLLFSQSDDRAWIHAFSAPKFERAAALNLPATSSTDKETWASLVMSDDLQRVLAIDTAGVAALFDTTKKSKIFSFDGKISGLRFAPGGGYLFAVDAGVIRVWSALDGKPLYTHTAAPRPSAFLVTEGRDFTEPGGLHTTEND